ncbi:MAG: glycosyltransferase family 2 protein [Defluviitaleaceae bacterium]|nr:glycosyltransferase family 2 protein [Defluviitaleaceae bacterium]MCL2274446.1 glycosyltransferase family 2 protein [Defluviitaleaceae bacterium]
MKPVAVVICTYNKCNYVINCINSVLESSFNDFDIIVVDNASSDNTVDMIKSKFGNKLTLLVNEKNTGGAGGFHRGMAYAMQKKYKYIHLLDNDVVVDKNAIKALYDFMELHPNAGACGSLILHMAFPETVQDYGAMIDIPNLGVKPLYAGAGIKSELPDFLACDYVAACSAMFRASALEVSGLIEEDYFIYWDDMALGWKLRLAGYKIFACKASVIWHEQGRQGLYSPFFIYYIFRNKIHTFVKYCTESEYNDFVKNLTTRLFRTFAVNRKRPAAIYTCFHALHDALEGVRGKGDDYKINKTPDADFFFLDKVNNSSKLLILFDSSFTTLELFIEKLRASLPDLHITLYTVDDCFAMPEGIIVQNEMPNLNDYDMLIKMCPHVLDLPNYDRRYVYLDKYWNQLVDEDDFYLVENYEALHMFYYNIFFPYIKSKLDVRRGVCKTLINHTNTPNTAKP